MGIIKRQTIQSSVYAYAGVVVGFLTQGLFFPNLFSKNQVGLLGLLLSLSVVLGQFANLGINSAGGRYFPYFRNADRQHNGYLLIAGLTTLTGFGLCVLGLWLARPWIVAEYQTQSSLFVQYYYLLIPLTLFTVFFNVFDTYARLLYDPVTGTLLQQFALRLFVLLAGAAHYFGWVTFGQFLGLWLLAYALPLVLMIGSVARSQSLFFSRRFVLVDPTMRRNLTRYGMVTLATGLSSQVIWLIDKWMINSHSGLADTGVYNTMSNFASVIALPATVLYKVASTTIAESWKANDRANVLSIYVKSCLNQLIAGCLVFVGVVANLPSVFSFLPAGYEAGYLVIVWLGIGKLVDMATGINGIILYTSRYYAYDSLFFVALIFITIGANQYLIPRFGITGAAVGAALATTLYNIVRTVFVGIAFRMQPFSWRNGVVVLLTLLVWWASGLLPYPAAGASVGRVLIDIGGRSAFITVTFLGPLYFLNLSPDLTRLLRDNVSRLTRRSPLS